MTSLVCTVLIASLLLGMAWPSPVLAAWGGLTPLDTVALFSDPSCASDAPGSGVCAAQSQASEFVADRYAGGKWGRFVALSGVIGGAPSCARVAPGHVLCGVRDAAGRLVAYSFAGGVWSGPVTVGGAFTSDPSCSGLAAGHALCVALDANGRILGAVFDGATWKFLPAVGVTAFTSVGCAPDDLGHAVCVWTGPLHHAFAMEFNGSAWLSALDLGGRAWGMAPACFDLGLKTGAVDCYATSTDQALYYNIYEGGLWDTQNWSGWESLGGTLTNAGCAQDGSLAKIPDGVCAATGAPDDSFYVWDKNNHWTALKQPPVLGRPSCFALDTSVSPGRAMCVVRGSNGYGLSVIGP
jgi:hypothetical protein